MKQAEIMLATEADAWYARNRDKVAERDPVLDALDCHSGMPKHVLEVGCSDGRRLEAIRAKYDCAIYGVDPSIHALIVAADRRVPAWATVASSLSMFEDASFDLVIYGFCLYLCDPGDWMTIAAEGDRVLQDGGHIVIHDFAEGGLFCRVYEHDTRLRAYHYDFSKLWLGNPLYHVVQRRLLPDDQMIVVLRKKSSDGIEVRP